MILAIDWMQYVIYFLYASLFILVGIIAYRYLLSRMDKKEFFREDFVELYSYEQQIATGEITLFFEVLSRKRIKFYLTDGKGTVLKVLKDGEFKPGGYNVKLDTAEFSDGNYYYCLQTDNQQTDKLLRIRNTSN